MHFFVSTYSFSVEMVKINVSCLQKYNKKIVRTKKSWKNMCVVCKKALLLHLI